MRENIITVNFDVESEGYKAITDLKKYPEGRGYVVSAASLIHKEKGHITVEDSFDFEADGDDAAYGGILGSLLGVIGGPLGILLGGSMGALIGGAVDSDDALENASLIEQVTTDIKDGDTALIALVQEDEENAFDGFFNQYSMTVIRHDAAEVAEEVEEAQNLQREMAKEARAKLRAEKRADRKQRIHAKREEIKAHFENLKKKS